MVSARIFVVSSLLLLSTAVHGIAASKESESAIPLWIWAQEHTAGDVPIGECYFRKTIHLPEKASGYIEIAADDEFKFYVNGKLVGEGGSRGMQRIELTKGLRRGRNILAAKVDNRNGTTAGLAVRVHVESPESGVRVYHSDPTWRAHTSALPLWNTLTYADTRWKGAQSFGKYGGGSLAGVEEKLPGMERLASQDKASPAETTSRQISPDKHPQFRLPTGFEVEHVLGGDDTGSLIALAFNEFGQILASQEGGPLLLIFDKNKNGVVDSVRTCCDRVRNCQGILTVSGRAYVLGEGPRGVALYRLDDQDRDGNFETVEAIVTFEGEIGEHGPHGMTLGPDGMIYLSLGNHTKFAEPVALTSPHQNYYEGDVTPKYEDPKGHARGIKAPGGGVLRVDLEGRRKELFAGGIRNAYDLAFNSEGDLFMHDSDMESDAGTPWHRPTRLVHVIPGGEYGWRSGWSKWPEYFVDSLPGVVDTGRGSPTGIVYYDHSVYPDEYRDVLFSCDWSQGQILAFRLEPKGASYRASREVFLEGRPMNVTDIDVGPDGWLYFCTGGRGTQGNLYRIIRTENRDARLSKLETVPQALQHPQPNSAWGRQRLSLLRRKLGTTWDTQLREFANNPSNPVDERRRALALMHLVGPPPTDLDLARYSKDANASVRIQAADLMGLIGNDVTHDRLIQLLADRNPRVRRHALEALARSSRQVSWEVLTPSLKSTDRFEAWAARRLLERNQSEVWPDQGLEASDPSLFIQGALASMIALPDTNRAIAIVARAQEMMGGFIPARQEIGVLRLIQVAMLRGQLQGGDVPGLGELLLKRFPQDDANVNREMIRLLVGIQHAPAIPAMVQYLQSDIPDVDKIHVATLIQFMESGWPPAGKFALLQFFEQAKLMEGGQNLSAYIKTIADEVANGLTVGEQMYVIQQGHLMPEAALTAMFALPESKDIEMIPKLMQVDQALIPFKGIAYDRLRIGIVAILARSKSPEAMGYLRQIHDRDPERRQTVAMGLAQTPDGRNWDYLVRSIPLLSGEPAREVLTQLRTVDYAPEAPEHLRQVILCGLRLQADGGLLATKLLEHWVGTRPPGARGAWQAQLAAWQIWFDERYPGEPVADLPTEDGGNTWTFEDLQAYLSSPEAESRSIENGAVVFEKAQCAACHIHGKQGIHLGPDLTTLARRFQTNEVLESIIYPSQVISDQYASKTVVTSDGKTRTGMVLVQNKQQIVLADPQGKEIKIDASEIEEINPSKLSVMPAGLLNDLSLEEIGDLFAFLMHVEEPRMVEFMEDMDVR